MYPSTLRRIAKMALSLHYVSSLLKHYSVSAHRRTSSKASPLQYQNPQRRWATKSVLPYRLLQETRRTTDLPAKLESLSSFGKSRAEAIFAATVYDDYSVYAPVSEVLIQRQQIICHYSTSVPEIANGVHDAAQNIMQGEILDGITSIIGQALDIVLEKSSGQQTTCARLQRTVKMSLLSPSSPAPCKWTC